jgi:hypothetical protein
MASVLTTGCINQANNEPQVLYNVHVKVVNSEKILADKIIQIEKGKSVLDATLAATTAEYKSSAMGAFVESIADYKPEMPFYWGLYVNGEYATKSASAYEVSDGMQVIWRVENFNETMPN